MTTPAENACLTALEAHLRPELFRALADPVRVALISRLALSAGPKTVTEVSDCCGVHLSGVSRHLTQLRAAGVVEATKAGREVRYTLDCEGLVELLRGLAEALENCRAVCCAGSGETNTGDACCDPGQSREPKNESDPS